MILNEPYIFLLRSFALVIGYFCSKLFKKIFPRARKNIKNRFWSYEVGRPGEFCFVGFLDSTGFFSLPVLNLVMSGLCRLLCRVKVGLVLDGFSLIDLGI